MFKDIDLSPFPAEREEKLKEIYRFSLFESLRYRSNLWMHTHRVLWLLDELIPIAQKYLDFDVEKARILALVHDDAEMITGDIQAGVKARMTPEELSKVEQNEKEALELLAERYPEIIHGYNYKELLYHSVNKDCIEAKIVSYVDKIDAQCESLHEVLSGNITLLRSVIFYTNTFASFPKKFPELAELMKSKESALTYLADVVSYDNVKDNRYTLLNKPWTEESILLETDFPFFNTWKKIVIEKGHKDWLLNDSTKIKL